MLGADRLHTDTYASSLTDPHPFLKTNHLSQQQDIRVCDVPSQTHAYMLLLHRQDISSQTRRHASVATHKQARRWATAVRTGWAIFGALLHQVGR